MIDDFKSHDSDPITTWDRVLLVIALIAALAVLSIKDADAADLRLSIDPGFSNYERAVVLQVANEWNVALAGTRRIEIGDGDWTLVETNATALVNAAQCEGGHTDSAHKKIEIHPNCIHPGALAPFLRHELGHVLGLFHMPGTVMAPDCCFDWQSIDAWSASMAKGSVRIPGNIVVSHTVR